ncbi:MAG: threonine--tRNA ligase [Bacteriovoracaceae bacterium]
MKNIHDHRVLGDKYSLFSFFEDKGPGFPVWKDHGLKIRNALIAFWRELHSHHGYLEMESPILLDKSLWEESGHMNYFRQNMYFSEVEKREYAVKPMSCPGAILVFKEQKRFFKELPLRLCELGHVHRHENSGSLHGLLRVRSFYQDDAHIFCEDHQLVSEVKSVISLIEQIMNRCGMKDFQFLLSVRSPGKKEYLGEDEDWLMAEKALAQALEEKGYPVIYNVGEAKFYGPSLDLEIKDAHGRSWQCSSIQLDFNLPLRFNLHYFDQKGQKKIPYMLHRAIYGSLERFVGILLEHYGRRLPFWLMPVQIKILCLAPEAQDYSQQVMKELRQFGFRVELDESDFSLSHKLKKSIENELVHSYLVIGKKEKDSNKVSWRKSEENQNVVLDLDQLVANLQA